MHRKPGRPAARHLLRWALAAAVCVLAVLAVLGSAGPASAHTTLVGSDPAEGSVRVTAPTQATLTFDEPVTLPADAVQVFDAEGKTLPSDSTARDREVTVELPDELADGTYVVTWSIVSGDGHPVSGSLTFSVGKPSENVVAPGQTRDPSTTVTAALGIAQAVSYLALFLAAGLIFFVTVLLPGAEPTGPSRRRLVRVARCAAALAATAAVLVVPLTALHQQYLGLDDIASGPAWDLNLVGHDLTIAILITVGLGLAFAGVGWAGVGWAGASGRWGVAVALTGAAVAVASPALVGHPRHTSPAPLVLATDMLHLVTGAVWLGGLVGLALSLGVLRHHGNLAAQTLARFSTVAAGTLALLVLAGSFMAWRIVGSWDALFGTRYGTLLLVKIGITVLIVALAGWNKFVLLPRTQTADGATRRRAFVGVRRAVTAEAALLVGVLMLTGFLVSQPPSVEASASTPVAQPEFISAEVGDLTVLLLMTPQRTGPNTLHVHVEDASGRPIMPYADPLVAMRSDDVDLGPVSLRPAGTGVYTAEVVIPEPGDWKVQVSLRVNEFENPVATLRMPVPGG